jgi:aryl-alcohol dehydrogenase-like predicted oxidoreductase
VARGLPLPIAVYTFSDAIHDAMKYTTLGRSGLSVSALGLGCMGMSECYGPSDDAESRLILERALELGINFLDSADSYGPHHNEALIGKFLAGRRERVIVATKFGFVRSSDPDAPVIDNSPDYIRRACEGSLRRLGVETLDLYYAHRIDPARPIEETVGAMAELVRAGKVRALGLSEVSAQTLRRAAAVHPIAALQSEYSLWARDVEREVLPTCRELGVSFVAFAPLGRGFLTGTVADGATLAADDYRRQLPRFQGSAAQHNLALVAQLEAVARELGCSAAQLALAWLIARSPEVIPIPGTRRMRRLEENAAAANIVLDPATRARLDALFAPGAIAGERYDADGMRLVDR